MSEDIRPHYYKHPSGVECCDITDHLDFNLGNALKYAWRWNGKNGKEDLMKAKFYLLRTREITPLHPHHSLQVQALAHKVANYERSNGSNPVLLAMCSYLSAGYSKDTMSKSHVIDAIDMGLRLSDVLGVGHPRDDGREARVRRHDLRRQQGARNLGLEDGE